jgi:hypothetical protein
MTLLGYPQQNKVLLCVKAALTEPKLVDEYITLISKKTGIPQFEVSLHDLEEALKILTNSEAFWQRARSMGIGSKLQAKKTRPLRRSVSSSSSSSSDDSSSSSSSDSSSEGGGLELGFSDDEAKAQPAPPPASRKIAKKKAVPQSEDESMRGDSSSSESSDSSSSSSSSSSAEDEAPPVKTNEKVTETNTPGSESSSSSSEEEQQDNAKKQRKQKMAGLAARRRAEMAAENPPPAKPDAAPEGAKAPRKLRQPYAYGGGQKENIRANIPEVQPKVVDPPPKVARPMESPPASPAEPTTKKPRVEEAEPVAEPPAPAPVADWNTDFGRLIRQAIDNRKICPFRTLGLGQSSSMAEVKKRWAKLCLLLHPDKAPAEWKTVPELVDANQAVNEAKRTIEQRFQAVALVRPQRPLSHPQPFTLDKGTFGKRRVEIRWQPSPVPSAREKVERYLVFIIHGNDPRRRDQMLNAGSVKEGTDPFFVIVEDDQRFARFFSNTNQITVSILASNAAGNSDPLTIVVPLR